MIHHSQCKEKLICHTCSSPRVAVQLLRILSLFFPPPVIICANLFFSFRLINRNTLNRLHWLFFPPLLSLNFFEHLFLRSSAGPSERLQPALPQPPVLPGCAQGRLVPLQIRQHVLRRALHRHASHQQGRWSDCSFFAEDCVWWLLRLISTRSISADLICRPGRRWARRGEVLIGESETLGGRKSRQIFFVCFVFFPLLERDTGTSLSCASNFERGAWISDCAGF